MYLWKFCEKKKKNSRFFFFIFRDVTLSLFYLTLVRKDRQETEVEPWPPKQYSVYSGGEKKKSNFDVANLSQASFVIIQNSRNWKQQGGAVIHTEYLLQTWARTYSKGWGSREKAPLDPSIHVNIPFLYPCSLSSD